MNYTTYLTHNFQAIHKPKPLREDPDELPAFDEAFNQDYLREFFRSTDSNVHSPSNSTRKPSNTEDAHTISFNMSFSPYKDHFYDDTQHSVADTNDTYISPQKDGASNDKTNYMQLAQSSNVKQSLDMTNLNSYTQGIYAALNCVNYSNNVQSDIFKPGGLETLVQRENTPHRENGKTKKKVFLIIRNAIPPIEKREVLSRKASDKSSVANVEKGTRKRGQRRVKDRLKSSDNINLNNYFNTNIYNDESNLKRRFSYATSEDLKVNKRVKVQKDLKGGLDGAFEFGLDAEKDFKPGYFDILPTISFDEIINRDYPEFTGNVIDNSSKH